MKSELTAYIMCLIYSMQLLQKDILIVICHLLQQCVMQFIEFRKYSFDERPISESKPFNDQDFSVFLCIYRKLIINLKLKSRCNIQVIATMKLLSKLPM